MHRESFITDVRAVQLSEAYQSLRRPLLAFLRKLTGDSEVAEDLLHDVVLKALASGMDDSRSTPRNLTGWLYAVARNAAMDHHRRMRPHTELPDDLQAPAPDEDEAMLAALASCLRPAADRLPETYRGTVIASEFERRPLADVAREQGVSLSAVKARASRGRRLLQQEIVECCRVALSAQGKVLDYDTRKAARCASSSSGCGKGCDAPS